MASDEQKIRDIHAEWFKATEKGDLSRIMPLMAEDAVFLTPGEPPFGPDVFAAQFKAGLQYQKIRCGGELEEVIVAGEIAYARCRLNVSVTPLAGGSPMRLAGYTLTIYRKEADGRWVLARDANLLAPVPEE